IREKEGHSDCDSKHSVHQADDPPSSEEAQEYQENVAKHRGFLARETRSTQDFPAPKPAKPARKPQSTTQKAPPKPSISSLVTSTQLAPTSPKSSPKSVVASEAKEVPAEEPQVADEDADYQKAVEEIMKDAYALPKGPLPPVVIRESERVSKPTASSFHDVSPYEVLGQSDNKEESEKIMLGDENGGQDEGQAGSNPDETSEGQAGPDPGNTEARVQSTSSPVVHAGSDREHMDLDVANVSPQPSTEQLDKGFTATVYPNVQENLKLTVEEPEQTFGCRQSAETKVESMVNVTIQQALSLISLMTSPIIDLTSRPESPKEHQLLKATTTNTTTTTTTTLPPLQAPQQSTTEAMMVKHIGELEHILADLIQVNKTIEERLDKHRARLYTLEQLDIPQQVSIAVSEVVTDAVDWAMQAPLHNRFGDLPEADMKEILHQRMWESDSYKSHEDHMQLFEALEKSMNHDHSEELAHDLAEARKKKKKGRESPKMPPGSPSHQPPAGLSETSGAPRAFGSQVTPPPPPPTSTNQDSPSKGYAIPSPSRSAATTEHQAWITPDVTLKPLISLTPADLDMNEAMGPDEQAQLSDEEDIGSAHIPTVNLRQGWWKSFEEERSTTPEPAWSIRSSDVPVLTNTWASALASNYSPPPEESVLAQTDDIAIFIDWFCKRRGINELKPQDLEGPAYEIVKFFHPDRVEDFQLGIESYQTQVILTKPQWTATGFEYKHDYTVIESPRAVIFWDKYKVQMMTRFNEIHKFSDGTLQQIVKALDYRVKEFRINRMNPGLNTRFWTRKDVDRCNAFMFTIQRHLRTRRIFRNLETFVGGHVKEGDYRLLRRTD
nr:hypothetical protein [Tanacetum cinerariifolium]